MPSGGGDSFQARAAAAGFQQQPLLARLGNGSAAELVSQWVTTLHRGALWVDRFALAMLSLSCG